MFAGSHDHILPRAPYRQWVLSLPHALRFLLAYDRDLCSEVLGLVTRVPAIGLVTLLAGLLTLGSAALIHFVTLPTEFDASFGKALPILKEGYIQKRDIPKVKRILRAAALTYVAASLSSLLSLGRWIALLRR